MIPKVYINLLNFAYVLIFTKINLRVVFVMLYSSIKGFECTVVKALIWDENLILQNLGHQVPTILRTSS